MFPLFPGQALYECLSQVLAGHILGVAGRNLKTKKFNSKHHFRLLWKTFSLKISPIFKILKRSYIWVLTKNFIFADRLIASTHIYTQKDYLPFRRNPFQRNPFWRKQFRWRTDSAKAYLAKAVSTKKFKFLFRLIKLFLIDSYYKTSINNV
jgi:hypothetical protein